ncbi:MAG: hypothetical protein D6710_03765 [Nitrospirae bacterium]|nr:MAG: hypothetical protein D6710_03765 [Nitrospirota bacterium]
MLKRGLILLVSAVMIFSFLSCSKKPEQTGPAAVVNGEEISMEDFQTRLKQRLDFHRQTAEKVDEKSIREAVIQEMVSEKLLLAAAKEKGIEVTDEEVNKAIENYTKIQGKEKIDEYLKKWNISEEKFKEQVRAQLMINKLINELVPEDSIKEEDMKDYYKNAEKPFIKQARVEVKLIQVMSKEEADRIKGELEKKVDFEKIGERINKEKKGIVSDYGWVEPRLFTGEIGEALKNLKEGEVGGPYKGKDGYYFLKVRKREKEKPMTYEEAREQIKRILLNQRRQAMRAHLVEERKKKSKIVINVS